MAVRREHGRWRYRVTVKLPDGSKKRICGTPSIDTKDAARMAEREAILRAIDPAPPAPPKKEVPRFEKFSDEFLTTYAETNNKPSEVASKRTMLALHLVPAFGHLRLDQIDLVAIERYKADKMRAKLSPKSINNHLTVLRRLLVVAREWGHLEHVPAIKWLKAPEPEFDFLDFDEADRLAAAADVEWRPMILVGLKAGLRLGELLALRWGDVDLVAGRLVVRRAVSRGVMGTPKSGKSREIPLGEDVLRALKAHRHLRGELVFCNPDGKLFAKGESKWPLWRACKRAGLRRIGWHVLRHTFASHLAMRGAPLKAVQELMGHATIEMTMRYAHLSPDVRRDVVRLLDRRGEGVAKAPADNTAGARTS